MSRQFWSETVAWATAPGTAVANTATETIVFPNTTLPGNFLQDGRAIRLRIQGQYSTTATPTLIFTLRFGGVAGTVLCKTAAVTLPTIVAGVFDLDIMVQTRSNGATGTVMAIGTANIHAGVAPTVASAVGNAATTPMTAGGVLAPAVATVDLTADTALSITATWSAASASNTLTGLNYTIEAMN
ncbi:UNVERIFIED_ORG: hypothetical protein ABID57_000693 [Arthrobacter sp. UYEF1]